MLLSISSSSCVNHTPRTNPIYRHGVKVQIRTSKTPKNPGRQLFSCAKYNTEGLLYCNYFKWPNDTEEKEIVNIEMKLLKKMVELQKIEEELVKSQKENQNNKLKMRRQQANFRCELLIYRLYCVMSVLVILYFIL